MSKGTRWTEDEYRAYIAKRDAEHNAYVAAGGKVPGAEPEQAVRNEPLGPAQGEKEGPTRCRVSVTSFRKRRCDPDNLCVKAFVDSLRYCGILEDDTADHIELHVRQEKAETDYTEIVVERLMDNHGPYGLAGDAKWSGPL